MKRVNELTPRSCCRKITDRRSVSVMCGTGRWRARYRPDHPVVLGEALENAGFRWGCEGWPAVVNWRVEVEAGRHNRHIRHALDPIA